MRIRPIAGRAERRAPPNSAHGTRRTAVPALKYAACTLHRPRRKCASRVPASVLAAVVRERCLVRERQSRGARRHGIHGGTKAREIGEAPARLSPSPARAKPRQETSPTTWRAGMRASLKRLLSSTLLVAFIAIAALQPVQAAEAKKSFKIAWSIYVGWMPWDYADQSGILKKWADKYGIKIELTQINDYVESINQYTAGQFDGCVMTNMDMLTIPSAGGVDSTALIVGDYSNGNDGVVLKGAGKKLADMKGQSVNLVELSVSHYLLARGLDTVGLAERDIKVVNTSDADIVSAFATPAVTATVTWKPQLAEITAMPKTTLVFDSSKTPGEILDLMVVNSAVLKANPKLGK